MHSDIKKHMLQGPVPLTFFEKMLSKKNVRELQGVACTEPIRLEIHKDPLDQISTKLCNGRFVLHLGRNSKTISITSSFRASEEGLSLLKKGIKIILHSRYTVIH